MIENFEKFYTMTPMKYYDCGGDFSKPKAKAMLTNEGNAYIATRKNDGEWCRIIKDANGNIKAQSRSISKDNGDQCNDHNDHHYDHTDRQAGQDFAEGHRFLTATGCTDLGNRAQNVQVSDRNPSKSRRIQIAGLCHTVQTQGREHVSGKRHSRTKSKPYDEKRNHNNIIHD